MATVSLTSTDLSCPFSSKKTSLWPALFRSPSASALMWRVFPLSSSTWDERQPERRGGECEGGRGQKLDYVRKLKLIHRCLAHKSGWSNKKRLQSSVKLKKSEAGGVRQAQCFLLFLISLTLRLGWSVSQHALGEGQRNMHRLMSKASLQLNFVINK